MLDKELPILLLPENSAARRRKYPILSMEKVVRPLGDNRGRDRTAFSCFYRFSFAQGNILEKYVGTGLVCVGAVNRFILGFVVSRLSHPFQLFRATSLWEEAPEKQTSFS
jgi:hypothetical protein